MSSNYTPFSFDKMLKIRKAAESALSGGAEPLAAFDADGTLWDMDMGEYFFDYQVRNKLLSNMPDDPWAFYYDLHKRDTPAAFLWLAQINRGVPLSQVREWSYAAFEAINPVPIFGAMKDLITDLKKFGADVYVVTASIKWAVEPAAEFMGIPPENVIGVQTQVVDGVVTDLPGPTITWREGKVTGLLEATGRRRPFLCAGNTMGDLALLDSATHFRVVNAAAPSDHVNRESEQALVEVAKKRGWYFHVYRP